MSTTGVLDRIAAFEDSRSGDLLVFAWGIAEAIAFPIVPDIVLGLFALASPRRLARPFALAVAGALVGTVVLFLVSSASPAAVQTLLLALPGIHPATIADARSLVAAGDPLSIAAFGPGTPLKVYTFAWASGAGSMAALLIGVVLNRLTRVGPGVVALAVVAALAPAFVRRHERPILVAYALFFTALYALYWR